MANKQHISDELLAAYLEGNVNEREMTRVLHAAKTDFELQEALDIALQLEEEELPVLQMAAEGGRNLCDLQCEAYVLRLHGIDCDEEELLQVAKDNHWIRRAGTPLNCMGNLMEYKGLKVYRKYNASIDDIREALNNRRGVVVAVDSDKLYPERPDEEDATNHAVAVTGIDADAGTIAIYDPENHEEVHFSISLFINAWKESHSYLVCATVATL